MAIENIPEVALRLGAFVLIFSLMAWLEMKRPKRRLRHSRNLRWPTNLAIVVIDSVVVRAMSLLAVPIAAVTTAEYAARNGIGILNTIDVPIAAAVLVSILALDFAIWLQHVASHKAPLLWRLHQMHHADQDIDATTAIRFHPVEIALSIIWKIIWVLALGAPPIAVLLFEIVLNGCAVFNHANIALPPRVDRLMRSIIVTPDMHRVHHSVHRNEHDSNFGFNFPFWDRLFRTYTPQPADGHERMTIGLTPYQTDGPTHLAWCLLLPFRERGNRD